VNKSVNKGVNKPNIFSAKDTAIRKVHMEPGYPNRVWTHLAGATLLITRGCD